MTQHLELLSADWLRTQPVYLEFSRHHTGHHKTRMHDFLVVLSTTGLIAFVDEKRRAFVDVNSPLWRRLTQKAQRRGFAPPLTRGDVTPVVKSGTRISAAEKQAKYRARAKRR